MNLAGYLSHRGPIVLQYESADVYNEVSAILRNIDELNEISSFVEVTDPIIAHISWGAAPVPSNYVPALEIINRLQGGVAKAVGNAGEPIVFLDDVNCVLQLNTDETYQRVVGALKVTSPAVGQVHIIPLNPTAIAIVN